MLVREDGPYMVFAKLRARLSDKPWNPLDCFYCTSIWVGIVVALVADRWVFTGLVLSTGSIFINLLHEKLE